VSSWPCAEEKFSTLSAKAAAAERQWVAVEEQFKRLVHELTLLSLRGSVLCMTIIGALPQAPLYKGMRFVVDRHTKVAMRLSTL
jgi:hypothetical protein